MNLCTVPARDRWRCLRPTWLSCEEGARTQPAAATAACWLAGVPNSNRQASAPTARQRAAGGATIRHNDRFWDFFFRKSFTWYRLGRYTLLLFSWWLHFLSLRLIHKRSAVRRKLSNHSQPPAMLTNRFRFFLDFFFQKQPMCRAAGSVVAGVPAAGSAGGRLWRQSLHLSALLSSVSWRDDKCNHQENNIILYLPRLYQVPYLPCAVQQDSGIFRSGMEFLILKRIYFFEKTCEMTAVTLVTICTYVAKHIEFADLLIFAVF
jgi:hypothetical protein